MISTNGITLRYGKRVLFQDVSIKFTPGNCYGLIGANGTGKSTFLKILSDEIKPDAGDIAMPANARLAVLKQNHFAFDEHTVLDTVIMGNRALYDIMKEKDALYAKPEMTEEEGTRVSDLEVQYADLGGWDAEAQAASMLAGLGIATTKLQTLMKDLEGGEKVRVLLAQALFGNPDVLLLDEPTNHLDVASMMWLEEFLIEFNNTVIVVSHDRHFLDKVCTHVADIDFGKISLYSGNYSFWYEASQLALKQKRDQNKKAEDKIKELKSFIERFSANASKSRQATSRKKSLAKLNVEEIKPSSRKYPHVHFTVEREGGKDLLDIKGLAGSSNGVKLFDKLNISVTKGEKVAFVGEDSQIATTLFQILMGEVQPDAGEFRWGVTTSRSYFPKDNSKDFDTDKTLIQWLASYMEKFDEEFIRGLLGRMLFSQEESFKKANVLSGGEKVRCLLARMMIAKSNVLVLDEPTNHLDLESITSLNEALTNFKGTVLFTSQDRQFVHTVATRIIEITPKGIIDREMPYDDYLESPSVMEERAKLQAKA